MGRPSATSIARSGLSPLLGRRNLQPLFSWLHRFALAGMGFGPSQTSETGELRLLAALGKAWGDKAVTIFDVGANSGQWAAEAIEILPLAEIHCFEPSPAAFEELTRNLSHPGLRPHAFALGDRDFQTLLFSDDRGSQLSSLYERQLGHHGHYFKAETMVTVKRLDTFCARAGISHIDLLKLDVEGGELAALHGAGDMLNDGSIEAVQFEFGTTTESRVFFKDLFTLLDPSFRLYRIIREGLVPIPEYREQYEIFLAANYLGVARTSAALAMIA